MNRSRGSQELAIRTDIDVPLRVVGEFATREHAMWWPMPWAARAPGAAGMAR
jgi:hypothetical protein